MALRCSFIIFMTTWKKNIVEVSDRENYLRGSGVADSVFSSSIAGGSSSWPFRKLMIA